LQIDH